MALALLSSMNAGPSLALAGEAFKAVDDARPDLAAARAHLNARQPQAALALLRPFEARMAGDPDFDFLIALAYLDTGQPTAALFALERVLARAPDHALARAELARAHAALGEVEAARHNALEAAEGLDVPEGVRRALRSFGAAQPSPDEATRYRVKARLGSGYDGNVSTATGASAIELPALADFGLAQLSKDARAQGSAQIVGGVDVDVIAPFSPTLAGILGLGADHHAYPSAHPFDLTTADLRAGLVATDGPRTVSATLAAQNAWLGGSDARRAFGLSLDYRVPVAEGFHLAPLAQIYRLTYPSQNARDTWRQAYGVAAQGRFGNLGLGLSVLGGHEGARNALYSQDFWGIRGALDWPWTSKLVAVISAGCEQRGYGAVDPLFLTRRMDRQADVSVGVRYDPGFGAILEAEATYTRNLSTIVIDAYNRPSVYLGMTVPWP